MIDEQIRDAVPVFQRAFQEIGHAIRYPGYPATPPSSGCCFVTAAVIQRTFGGRLLVNRRNHSFINEINGRRFDITSDQYGLVPPAVNPKWNYVEYNRKPRTKRIEILERYVNGNLCLPRL